MEPRRGTILAMERLSKLMAAVTSEPLGWHATLFREWVLYNALAFTILLATVYTLAGTSLDLVEQAAGRTAATLALSLGAALRRRARLAPVAGAPATRSDPAAALDQRGHRPRSARGYDQSRA